MIIGSATAQLVETGGVLGLWMTKLGIPLLGRRCLFFRALAAIVLVNARAVAVEAGGVGFSGR